MKHRAGKVAPAVPGNTLLSAYYALKRLERQRKGEQWKLAQAAATTPFLLIGKPAR